ncbi:uncharacterized protein CDAR_457181 [Caerostris darwini]|uniref:Uncharacterized protein n=1 Tax=Caerostris darwini TaxID=1538125 RepID=A0AAV4PE55_9ARAC|nr:uncharacterized protein CDAR_457181 [Caerostris darwini]
MLAYPVHERHIFGDAPKPLDESAILVEKILRDQMNMLLIKASEISPRISRRSLTHEHIIFLLKENKDKLRRLLHYLNLKDASESISRQKFTCIKDVMIGKKLGKRLQLCLKYLQKIDPEEYGSLNFKIGEDPITVARNKRRYLMTYNMTDKQYLEYSKKLQVSFCPKEEGSEVFCEWLLVDNVTHLMPTPLALDMICFLARETVAEISKNGNWCSPWKPSSSHFNNMASDPKLRNFLSLTSSSHFNNMASALKLRNFQRLTSSSHFNNMASDPKLRNFLSLTSSSHFNNTASDPKLRNFLSLTSSSHFNNMASDPKLRNFLSLTSSSHFNNMTSNPKLWNFLSLTSSSHFNNMASDPKLKNFLSLTSSSHFNNMTSNPKLRNFLSLTSSSHFNNMASDPKLRNFLSLTSSSHFNNMASDPKLRIF